MRRVLLFSFVFILSVNFLSAQDRTCVPDSFYADSTAGVYPKPYSDINPLAGIGDTVCLGTEFEYTLTLNIPDSFATNTVLGTVPVFSFSANPDNAVSNLPEGFDFVCNPPNCVFSSETGLGCILLYGSTNDAEAVGQYDLAISGQLNSIISLNISFPDSVLFTAGNYFLDVAENGTGPCIFSSTAEPFANKFSLQSQPNPFVGQSQVLIQSKINGSFTFSVHNLFGQLQYQERVQLMQGENRIPLDGSNLEKGMYLVSISDGFQGVSTKVIVQ